MSSNNATLTLQRIDENDPANAALFNGPRVVIIESLSIVAGDVPRYHVYVTHKTSALIDSLGVVFTNKRIAISFAYAFAVGMVEDFDVIEEFPAVLLHHDGVRGNDAEWSLVIRDHGFDDGPAHELRTVFATNLKVVELDGSETYVLGLRGGRS